MEKWFEKQSRLVQLILLLIPGVNWVIEVLVRWSHALRKGNLFKYIIAIVVTFAGLVFGWVDLVWCLLFKHMIFCK
jgi:hypothetical protein